MMAADIEQIVAEVVRRLTAAMATDAARSESAAKESDEPKQPTVSLAAIGGTSGLPLTIAKTKRRPDAPRQSRPANAGDVLLCEERLLTLATLEGKLDGLRRLVVHRKAIVTPSLREELSRRGIELDRGGQNGAKRAEVAVSVLRFDAERAPSLHGLGLASEETVKSFAALVKRVRSEVESGERLVFVLTRQATAALCVLNRLREVRAAAATNVESVRSAAKSIAANVLVVDPGHLGRVQLTALVRAFENEYCTQVPDDLRSLISDL